MKTNILLISASCMENSHSACNAETVLGFIEQQGSSGYHWNLKEKPLPFHDATEHHNIRQSKSEAIRRFVELADGADGFVWCTPNYHNSFSGVLKNALDNLTMQQVAHKPILLISNGGGRFGSQPCEQLRLIARGLHGNPIPAQVVTQNSDFSVTDGQKQLEDESIRNRVEYSTKQLLVYSRAGGFIRNELS